VNNKKTGVIIEAEKIMPVAELVENFRPQN